MVLAEDDGQGRSSVVRFNEVLAEVGDSDASLISAAASKSATDVGTSVARPSYSGAVSSSGRQASGIRPCPGCVSSDMSTQTDLVRRTAGAIGSCLIDVAARHGVCSIRIIKEDLRVFAVRCALTAVHFICRASALITVSET